MAPTGSARRLLVLLAALPLLTGAAARAKFQPPEGRILLIIGQDLETVAHYVEGTGLVPGGCMTYTSLQQLDGLDEPADHGGGLLHADALVRRYPQSVLQLGLYMVDALEPIAAGEYDTNIRRLAGWLKRAKVPVYLRIGYEFDAPPNHYEPQAYQRAYRHLVDLLREEGVTNVATVWHSYAAKAERPLEEWYPGDGYVDWVGLSYFGQNGAFQERVVQFAAEHGKPVMIAEATPAGVGTALDWLSWQAWFADFFRFVKEHAISVVSYVNTDWNSQRMWQGQGWEDARVEANSTVRASWLEEVTRPTYLHASPELFALLGHTDR